MSNLRNSVRLMGNVGNDPEIKSFDGNKKLAKFSLATNESYKNDKGEKVTDTQWHNIVVWGSSATFVEKYVKKGHEVALEGKITYNNYTDKEGVKRYGTDIVVSEIIIVNGDKK